MSTPLLRLANGDEGAVVACVDAYGPLVNGLAHRLLPEHDDVEDVVQEVFVELWRHSARFDPAKASDRGFVSMLARRRIIDHRRRAGRRPETVTMTPDRDPASDEYERTLGRVQAGPVLEALATLAEDRRRLILMSVVEGRTHREIAEYTGSPLGTVKSSIRRGLADMRRCLEKHHWLETQENTEAGP